MRDEARDAGVAARCPYVAGVAEALPFAPARFEAVWISAAVHQFDDLAAVAAEVRRVTCAGGSLLIRGFFSDVPITGAFGAFPGIERAATRFPSTEVVRRAFAAAGCRGVGIEDVVEPWRADARVWIERVRAVRSTDSLLQGLDDREVEQGIERVMDTCTEDGGVRSDTTLRLLVFTV